MVFALLYVNNKDLIIGSVTPKALSEIEKRWIENYFQIFSHLSRSRGY
jgi:hypothetical protein